VTHITTLRVGHC